MDFIGVDAETDPMNLISADAISANAGARLNEFYGDTNKPRSYPK